ncbi:transcriptional regulator [Bordetella sp. H567]|uniref:IclR family transcriptional regulator n=1 Tax=Bordetella sp. H567 TaxID=1697043 RepID=UPI00081C7A65|nr:IclR family transcriptional regulator [Bordetella sp. H567]AOB32734.1 transcriptional regulator [Bordetella sp. H567]
MENDKRQEGVRAVDRALDILLAFRPGDDGLTAAELLKRVDLSRPTLYRLLATLEHNGFLVSSGDPQQFRLGSSVARLAHVWTSSHNIADIAYPSLQRLWEGTGETVALFVREGIYRVCVSELASAQPLSFRRGVGYREKLVLGASGRTILARMNLTEKELKAYAADTKVDTAAYMAELERVRKQGYATSRHELIEGAVAVAAPYFNGADLVVGSLCIFGPSVRMTAERVKACGAMLLQEATVLSRALGQQQA